MEGLMTARKDSRQPTQSGSETDGESVQATPEEQAQYDQFVKNGMRLMYGDKQLRRVIQSIKGDGNVAEGLANTLVSVVTRLEDTAEQAGQKLSGDVMLHGSQELLEQMADLAAEAGVKVTDKDLESALYIALDQYRQLRQQQGKLDQGTFQQDIGVINDAEQKGELDQLLPGISKAPQPSPQGPQASQPQQQARRKSGLMV